MNPDHMGMDVVLSVHVQSQTGSCQTCLAPDGDWQRWRVSAVL